eukprot:TRINITY_DN6530_c0_g1_i1.p1 TRINITY_DN6530_c0_g1~~TRINITY_DN6530_c0_g1_i1.p1  ORF type:complete len:498 (+),score=61.61 TRINITY_DN6530_c0_g1_i1:86-1495(+)
MYAIVLFLSVIGLASVFVPYTTIFSCSIPGAALPPVCTLRYPTIVGFDYPSYSCPPFDPTLALNVSVRHSEEPSRQPEHVDILFANTTEQHQPDGIGGSGGFIDCSSVVGDHRRGGGGRCCTIGHYNTREQATMVEQSVKNLLRVVLDKTNKMQRKGSTATTTTEHNNNKDTCNSGSDGGGRGQTCSSSSSSLSSPPPPPPDDSSSNGSGNAGDEEGDKTSWQLLLGGSGGSQWRQMASASFAMCFMGVLFLSAFVHARETLIIFPEEECVVQVLEWLLVANKKMETIPFSSIQSVAVAHRKRKPNNQKLDETATGPLLRDDDNLQFYVKLVRRKTTKTSAPSSSPTVDESTATTTDQSQTATEEVKLGLGKTTNQQTLVAMVANDINEAIFEAKYRAENSTTPASVDWTNNDYGEEGSSSSDEGVVPTVVSRDSPNSSILRRGSTSSEKGGEGRHVRFGGNGNDPPSN